jgi:hypothetical protein
VIGICNGLIEFDGISQSKKKKNTQAFEKAGGEERRREGWVVA